MDSSPPISLLEDLQPTPNRQPLRNLPATPLNMKRPAPIRIMSSSPSLCIHSEVINTVNKADVLTPPMTPITMGSLETIKSVERQKLPNHSRNMSSSPTKMEQTKVTADITLSTKTPWSETTPKLYTGTYQLTQEYGRGLWSTVRAALEVSSTLSPAEPSTPPSSPLQTRHIPSLLAIKLPLHPSSNPVLAHEARILTYLHQTPLSTTHIIAFHGFHSSTHSLVLAAVPLTLATHATTSLHLARAHFSTRTMFDPVVGLAVWKRFARALVAGLAFLHANGCVHGDIKPANILLSPNAADPSVLDPLFADFSSAYVVEPEVDVPGPNMANDAITTAFAAPELLAAYALGGEGAVVATRASDVFALGVTLVVAATGESPYGSARSDMQVLAMAREGRPLAFARGGEQASRVMRGREVERWVEGAVRGEESRWVVEEWVRVVEGG